MERESSIADNHILRRRSGPTFSGSLAVAALCGTLMVGAAGSWADALPTRPDGLGSSVKLQSPHVVVVKSTRTLYLFDGAQLVRTFPVKLGSHPAGQKTRAGDGRTPEGVFRICTKNAGSRNHRFLGIDYPDRAAVDRGLRAGLISSMRVDYMGAG